MSLGGEYPQIFKLMREYRSERANVLSQIGLIAVQESLTWPSVCAEP